MTSCRGCYQVPWRRSGLPRGRADPAGFGVYMRKFDSDEKRVEIQTKKMSRANLSVYPQDEAQEPLLTQAEPDGEQDGQSVPDSPRSRWAPSEPDLPSLGDYNPTSPMAPTEIAGSDDDAENPNDLDPVSGRPRWLSPFNEPPIEPTSMLGILKASADQIIDPEDDHDPDWEVA